MIQDEIIALANKAGWDAVNLDDGFGIRLKKFAALVEEKALAEHAMQEVQRLGQEIEQEPDYWLGYGLQAHTEKPFEGATPLYTKEQL